MQQPPSSVRSTPRDDDLDLLGGKGRSLARASNAGFAVPGGFHVTTAAYRAFVAEHGLQERIVALAKPELVNGAVSFDRASAAIQELLAEHAPVRPRRLRDRRRLPKP